MANSPGLLKRGSAPEAMTGPFMILLSPGFSHLGQGYDRIGVAKAPVLQPYWSYSRRQGGRCENFTPVCL
ncbi:hypothetical protein VTH06DRAFT_3571 [Thermothelomyces fergusii]